MSSTPVGIHDISFATTSLVLDLGVIATRMGIDPQKYYSGIGQVEMSVPARDEDIVTLAANAALPIVERHGRDRIRTVIVATETGIDQSKAAAVYVHRLLGLGENCRAVEFKQACYSATAALQFAAAIVQRDPQQQVLVVATDVARYDLQSSGEPTQGAGAAAMLVAADPAIIALEPVTGLYTEDIMDFWRPNHRDTALVDGKTSIRAYLHAIEHAWQDAQRQGAPGFEQIDYFCYHQPFTVMAVKAHRHLVKIAAAQTSSAQVDAVLEPSLIYNRQVGNSYTASMYIALVSLLDNVAQLDGKRIAFLSYGSGCVAEIFTGVVQPGYASHLRTAAHAAALQGRTAIDDADYLARHAQTQPTDAGAHPTPHETTGHFRYAGLSGNKRLYEATPARSDRAS